MGLCLEESGPHSVVRPLETEKLETLTLREPLRTGGGTVTGAHAGRAPCRAQDQS